VTTVVRDFFNEGDLTQAIALPDGQIAGAPIGLGVPGVPGHTGNTGGPDLGGDHGINPTESRSELPPAASLDQLAARPPLRHARVERLNPVFPVTSPLLVQANGNAVVDLGSPVPGYRWLIHQLAYLPSTSITSEPTGVACHFYISGVGLPSTGGAAVEPALTEWIYSFFAINGAFLPLSYQSGTSPWQILPGQHLIAFMNAGTPGMTFLAQARIEQVPDRKVMDVQEV
jgi:hypothetical protein